MPTRLGLKPAPAKVGTGTPKNVGGTRARPAPGSIISQSNKQEAEESKDQMINSPLSSPKQSINQLQLPTRFQLTEPATVVHRSIVVDSLHADLSYQYDASTVPSLESIDESVRDAKTLDLSFRSLICIDHLSPYLSLVKLQLDNNKIRKIENLSCLPNLEWLDLSFNEITVIESLEALTKLTDLSLGHNQITHISGLDAVAPTLQCLSLNHNAISDMSEVTYLRPFSNLRVFSLKANPCEQKNAEDYILTIHAFLPQLTYLDYAACDPEVVKKARDNKLDQLLLLEQKESSEKEKVREMERAKQRRNANIRYGINGIESLFKHLIDTDSDLTKFGKLPNIAEFVAQYQNEFNVVVEEYEIKMAEISSQKTDEEMLMLEADERVNEIAADDSRLVMKKWRRLHKDAVIQAKALLNQTQSINQSSSRVNPSEALTASLTALHTALQSSCRELASIEMLRVTTRRDLHAELEKALTELSKVSLNETMMHFKRLVASSATFATQCLDAAHAMQTSLAVDPESFAIEHRSLLADKDALATMLSSSRDHHDSQILAREDEIREREESTLKAKSTAMRSDEIESNRVRQTEINEWRRRQEQEMEKLVMQIVQEEEEEQEQ